MRDSTRLNAALHFVLRRYGAQLRRRRALAVGAIVFPPAVDVLTFYVPPPLLIAKLLVAMFHRSIADNIRVGRTDATDAEVRRAAQRAHAAEFIEALPTGYATLIGERGVKLSGGKRQRLAIARAILKDAPILILDEATSSLGSESEALMQDALWKLLTGRTAIVIAHRLSTVRRMDELIIFDCGKIAERGTHDELLARGGMYASLWAHQSGGFLVQDSVSQES